MIVTPALLASAMMGCPPDRAAKWAPWFDQACAAFEISLSATRLADFIAQVGHESGGLLWTREIWGPDQVPEQRTYERDFAMPWGPQLKRGDRNFKAFNMGNASKGDGYAFRGRGPIQLTGRKNYAAFRDRMREMRGVADVPDFEVNPALLETAQWGAWAAADYWHKNDLNRFADAQDFVRESEIINGGQKGLDDRLARRVRARKALGVQ